MEIFPLFLFPYVEAARRKEKVELRVRVGVRVRALYVTSSRDCRTSPLLSTVSNCLCGPQVLCELSNTGSREDTALL
jgi:hypothetical protein